MSDHEIKHAVDTNVTAQILLMKTAFRRFKAMKGGLIVNINSLAYQQPSANETIYCATKFALKGFSKALQMEAIGTGVEIIDVHPGGIQTNMTQDRKGFETMMRPEDVAAWIIDTVDRDSGYINEIVLRKRNETVLEELNKPLEVREVGLTELKFGQVLVKILVSGICGAQLHEIKGHKGNGKFLPHLMGHEGCGIVEPWVSVSPLSRWVTRL